MRWPSWPDDNSVRHPAARLKHIEMICKAQVIVHGGRPPRVQSSAIPRTPDHEEPDPTPTRSPGGMTLSPRGVPHAFRVLSPAARLLTLHTPGSGGSFYWTASEPATADTEGPVDYARVQECAKNTGAIEILGPPPFATKK